MTVDINTSKAQEESAEAAPPLLYTLGRITQNQENLSRGMELLRQEMKDYHLAAERRMVEVEHAVHSLGARFDAQVRTCVNRAERSTRLKHPWYVAAVGAMVAAASGLLGALASLVLKGGA